MIYCRHYRHYTIGLMGGILLFCCLVGRADTNPIDVNTGLQSSEDLSNSLRESQIDITLQIGFETYTELSTRSRQTSSDILKTDLGFRYFNNKGAYAHKIDLGVLHSTGENWPYLNLTEAYSSMELANDMSLTLGRKKHSWSWGDQFMGRGLWQPRFQWNKLHPKSQGLMGFFLQSPLRKSGFHWTVLASPVFMPDIQSHLREENGRIQSNNPWFQPPPQSFYIRGKETKIDYTLDKPSVEDLIIRSPGGATKLEWRNENIQWGFSWAYKPMNQVHVYAPVALNIENIHNNDPRLEVAVNTAVEYHKIWTQELNWTLGSWGLKLDFTYDQPMVPTHEDNHLVQNLSDARVYTALLSKKFNKAKEALELFWGHSYVDGGGMGWMGELSSVVGMDFESRYMLTNTTVVGMNHFLSPLLGSRAKSELMAAYDWDQNGVFVKSLLGMQWHDNLMTYFQWDMLGLIVGGKELKKGHGIISHYHNNDVMKIGVSYAF